MIVPPSVKGPGKVVSYGGSQMWFENPKLVNSGCGIVAGLDAVLMLEGVTELTRAEYLERLNEAATYIKPINLPFEVGKRKILGKEFYGSFGVSANRFVKGVKALGRSRNVDISIRSFATKWRTKLVDAINSQCRVVLLIQAPLFNVTLKPPVGKGENVGFHWVSVEDVEENSIVVSSWGCKYRIGFEMLDKSTVAFRFYCIQTVG